MFRFVLGKAVSKQFPRLNPAWYQRKTVAGSLAVLLFTYFSIMFPCTILQKWSIAVAAAVAEAVGGDYDNLVLAAVVLGSWVWTSMP